MLIHTQPVHWDPQAISYKVSFSPVNSQPIDHRGWMTQWFTEWPADKIADGFQSTGYEECRWNSQNNFLVATQERFWRHCRQVTESQNCLCSLLEVKQTQPFSLSKQHERCSNSLIVWNWMFSPDVSHEWWVDSKEHLSELSDNGFPKAAQDVLSARG